MTTYRTGSTLATTMPTDSQAGKSVAPVAVSATACQTKKCATSQGNNLTIVRTRTRGLASRPPVAASTTRRLSRRFPTVAWRSEASPR